MILNGNSRGGGGNLATHLLKPENEHIEIFDLRGFASGDLNSAFQEAYAISKATKCQKYLYSLSLNPPEKEKVSTADFEMAIERVEKKLGLTGQPRAIIFHEKQGRRHAHAVWSRIDENKMKAIELPFNHLKLRDISRDLFMEHGWTMPRGFVNSEERNPKNFTLAEWQQAKRVGKDPRAIKTDFQDAWSISDSKTAFTHALEERGYKIARGNRRGFVAVDTHGEVYSIPRQANVKTRAVRERLGDEEHLPSVDEVKAQFAKEMIPALLRMKNTQGQQFQDHRTLFEGKREKLVKRQQRERKELAQKQVQRQAVEIKTRQGRFRTGLKGFWDRVRGQHARIRKQNELEASQSYRRDRQQKDALIFRHLGERQHLQRLFGQERGQFIAQRRELRRDITQYKSQMPKDSVRVREISVRQRQDKTATQTPPIRGPDLTPER